MSHSDNIAPSPTTPTLAGNFTKGANVLVSAAVNAMADGINSTAEHMGIDPNKSVEETVSEAYHLIAQLNQVLATPEGQALKQETAQLLEEMVATLEPSVKKTEHILLESATRLGKNGVNAGVEILTAVPPILAGMELANVIASGANVAKTGLNLASTGMDAVKDVKEQHGPQAKSLVTRAINLFNTVASDGLNMAEKATKEYGHRVADETNALALEQTKTKQKQRLLQQGGALEGNKLSTYRKEAKIIGGRILKSHTEFLYPFLHNQTHNNKHNKKNNKKHSNFKSYTKRRTNRASLRNK